MNAMKFTKACSFSTERFIEEIRKHPILWDTTCSGYGDKIKKQDTWDELCAIFIGGWQEMGSDERFVKARGLQRRWKSLRDCFRRELKLKSNSTSTSRRPYLFYKQLKFLLPFTDTKELENVVLSEASENDDTEDVKFCGDEVCIEPTTLSPALEEMKPRKSTGSTGALTMSPVPISVASSSLGFDQQTAGVNQTQTFENQLLGILSRSIETRVPTLMNTDEDQLFLLSLAGELRKVPEERKLMLKSEIINCILRAQQN